MSSWLVTFTEATDVAARSDLLSQWKAEGKINGVGRQFEIINTAVVEATPEQIEGLKSHAAVKYIEPNSEVRAMGN